MTVSMENIEQILDTLSNENMSAVSDHAQLVLSRRTSPVARCHFHMEEGQCENKKRYNDFLFDYGKEPSGKRFLTMFDLEVFLHSQISSKDDRAPIRLAYIYRPVFPRHSRFAWHKIIECKEQPLDYVE